MDPGSHVGFQISTKNTNLVEDHLMNISGKFGSNPFSGFREEDLNAKSIMCSHWLKFKKSSCQKPPSQLNCDFAGMIIGWSCTKHVNRLPIGNSRWPP
jgi:hypothetical protein